MEMHALHSILRILAVALLLSGPALAEDAEGEGAPPTATATSASDDPADASPVATDAPLAAASAEPAPPTPAADGPGDEAADGAGDACACVPSPPAESSLDWVELESGEWLSGSIDRIRDDVMDFDSEELDDLTLDLADIVAIRAASVDTWRFGRRDIQTGVARMDGDTFTIETAGGVVTRKKSDLHTMIPGQPKESNYWSFEASAGLTARQGNTDQADISSFAKLKRETALTEFVSDYNGNYSETDGVVQANSHRASTAFNLFLTQSLYLVVPQIEYYKDEVQNIEARIVPAAGLGYEILSLSKVDWSASIAGGYQYLVNSPPMPGDTRSRSSDAALLFETNLELDPTDDLEWDTLYQGTVIVTDVGQTSHHLLSTLSFDLWGPIDFDTTFVWDRIEDPAPNSDGTVPQSDDYRLTVGLGIDI